MVRKSGAVRGDVSGCDSSVREAETAGNQRKCETESMLGADEAGQHGTENTQTSLPKQI